MHKLSGMVIEEICKESESRQPPLFSSPIPPPPTTSASRVQRTPTTGSFLAELNRNFEFYQE